MNCSRVMRVIARRSTTWRWALAIMARMPEGIRNAVRNRIEGLPTGSRVRQKLLRTFLSLQPDIESIYFDNFSVFARSLQNELVDTRNARAHRGY